MYIASHQELDDFIARALSAKILCIDTEFLREKTYYARLCLLQMATETEIVLVDPLAIGDISRISCLLESDSITKVFHAAQQDMEILYHETGTVPKPIFDTQVTATLLGYTQQIGYAALVQSLCHVTLKKVDSFSDWSIRPLTESQLAYAEDDVAYLPKMYDLMVKRLEERGRLSWLDAEFAEMVDPKRFANDPRERYRHLKRASHLSRRQLSAARELAAWREETAQRLNIPRKWVLSDEQVVEACKREPRNVDELFNVRGVKEKLSIADARTVVHAIDAGLDLPETEWPEIEVARISEKNVDEQLDLMMALVRLRSREHDVAMQTLVSHKELASLARGYRNDLEVLKGWRKLLIGDELVDLLQGRLLIGIGEDGLVIQSAENNGLENEG